MKNYFFILGLPRTRTSWLANFFTYTDVFCYHEALKFCTKIQDMKDLLDELEEPNVGNSDCSLINYFDEIHKTFPNAKYVLVERRPNEVVESLLDFQLMDDYEKTEKWIDSVVDKIKNIKKNYGIYTIKYEDLNNMEVIKDMWSYIMPHQKFNKNRWFSLDEIYVNILIGKSYIRMVPENLFFKFNSRKKIDFENSFEDEH